MLVVTHSARLKNPPPPTPHDSTSGREPILLRILREFHPQQFHHGLRPTFRVAFVRGHKASRPLGHRERHALQRVLVLAASRSRRLRS